MIALRASALRTPMPPKPNRDGNGAASRPLRQILPLFLIVALAFAETKPLPNQAGNDDLDLTGALLLERPAIQDAVGADLGPGYVVVHITAMPKAGKPLRLSPDDFLLLSRKNGDRSPALDPAQFGGGSGGLVVKAAAQQPGGDGTRTNGPIWGGVQKRIGGDKT